MWCGYFASFCWSRVVSPSLFPFSSLSDSRISASRGVWRCEWLHCEASTLYLGVISRSRPSSCPSNPNSLAAFLLFTPLSSHHICCHPIIFTVNISLLSTIPTFNLLGSISFISKLEHPRKSSRFCVVHVGFGKDVLLLKDRFESQLEYVAKR